MPSESIAKYLRKSVYKDDCMAYFENELGIKFPRKPLQILGKPTSPGLRDLIEDVCSGKVTRAIGKGPRGGGKTQGAAGIETYLWDIHDFDGVTLGGSQSQSNKCFSYVREFFMKMGRDKGLGSFLLSLIQAGPGTPFLTMLAASEKQVRSPHAGNANRGGLLILDEEATMHPRIVSASKPILSAANPAVIVHLSTFQDATGTFADTWDRADEINHKRYEWDCFDVCQKCEDECGNCIPDFAEDIYESNGELRHKAYCGGRAHYAEGWIPVQNIIDAWTERASLEEFEVEWMGSRPSGLGFVIRDRINLSKCFISEEKYSEIYQEALASEGGKIGVDWGRETECAIVVVKQIRDFINVVLRYYYFHKPSSTELYELIQSLFYECHCSIVNGDSSHPFCNDDLGRVYGLPVQRIFFEKDKPRGVARINNAVETSTLWVPEFDRFAKLKKQLLGWKRDKNGKIVKKDDHGCDALLCAMTGDSLVEQKALSEEEYEEILANLPNSIMANQQF